MAASGRINGSNDESVIDLLTGKIVCFLLLIRVKVTFKKLNQMSE